MHGQVEVEEAEEEVVESQFDGEVGFFGGWAGWVGEAEGGGEAGCDCALAGSVGVFGEVVEVDGVGGGKQFGLVGVERGVGVEGGVEGAGDNGIVGFVSEKPANPPLPSVCQ